MHSPPTFLLGLKDYIYRLTVVALGTFAISLQSNAQVVLQSGTSVADINPGSQQGMFHWDIQGLNQLQQQWFWFGIGNQAVHSIDTLSPPLVQQLSGSEAVISYSAPGPAGFTISVDYNLTGGNPVPPGQQESADIAETIKISNTGTSPLPIHFYQYSYFNLMGQSSDVVQLGQNIHGLYNEADQNSTSGAALSETVVTPGANAGEAEPLGVTLAKLNSGGSVLLSDNNGPQGPGAVTWALQWNFNIAPGNYQIISKDKYLSITVPEPSGFVLAGLGLVGLALRFRGSFGLRVFNRHGFGGGSRIFAPFSAVRGNKLP